MRKNGPLRIPDNDTEMKRTLLISTHLKAEHRGVETTVQQWFPLCLGKGMRETVEDFVKERLSCAAHLLVLLENLVEYVWLQPEKGPGAHGTVREVLRWRAGWSLPKMWTRDEAS